MRFSPDHRKSLRSSTKCCAPNCESRKNKNSDLSFHRIPKLGVKISIKSSTGKFEQVDKREEWLKIFNINDSDKTMYVCSLHFKSTDYSLPDYHAKHRILRSNAIPAPSITSVIKEEISRSPSTSVEREDTNVKVYAANKKLKYNSDFQYDSSTSSDIKNISVQEENIHFSEVSEEVSEPTEIRPIKIENIIYNQQGMLEPASEPDQHDVFCQEATIGEWDCNSGMFVNEYVNCQKKNCHDLTNSEKNDPECGEARVQVVSNDLLLPCCSFIKSDEDLVALCNIKSFEILQELTKLMDEYYPKKDRQPLSTSECILLTTAKLKLGVPFNVLGVFFRQVCEVTIRNIFYDTIKKLSTILQATITRVPKEEILRNIPKSFENFQSLTSLSTHILIKIQKPKCLKCSIKFYSHYKGDHTIKFMTEVTPAGLITSVSEPLDEQASDNQQLLEENTNYNEEVSCKVEHIERINQRIKLFQVLSNEIPWYFINHVDDIFIVCCGLSNLGTPVFADDEFT